MSLPSGGWLPENLLTGGVPFDGPLPVEYSGHYSEGGDGTILGATEIDFVQAAVIFEQSFIRERFGYGLSPGTSDFARVLTIDLVQAEVFGVLLLDSFTPPAISNEFFEFPAYQQAACVGGISAAVPIFGLCASGTPTVATEVLGTSPVFTEQS